MSPEELPFRNPLTQAQHGKLLEVAAGTLPDGFGRAVDIGCGKGEALARLCELRLRARKEQIEIFGIDPDADAIQQARARHEKIRGADVEPIWVHRKWQAGDTPLMAFDLAICLGSRHAFGEEGSARETMVRTLTKTVVDGGSLLIADGYWRQPPESEYLEAAGLKEDEMISLEEWHALFAKHRLDIKHEELTSPKDFEAYERVFWAQGGEHWQKWSDAFQRWGKETMGFAGWVLSKR